MAFVRTIQLAHLPAAYPLYIGLFEGVQNAPFLRQQLLDGKRDFEYAFIDASMILSTTHLLAAAHRAINNMIHNRLQSHNVHSEIVFCLGSTNNITTTLRAFGISAASTAIIAVKVGGPPSDPTGDTAITSTIASSTAAVRDHLNTHVQGTAIPFTDEAIANFSDVPQIRKVYKLVPAQNGKPQKHRVNGVQDHNRLTISAAEREELSVAAMGVMALRGS